MTARTTTGALLCVVVGAVGTAAAPAPAADDVTKAERAGLSHLHRSAVKLFIDRNGFGFSRMEVPLTDVLMPPKSQADRPAVAPDAAAIRPDRGAKDAHFSFAKSVGQVAYVPSVEKGKAWVVKDVQLVGLVKHPDPVVYLAGGAAMIQGKDDKTRRPDEFEAKALEVIRGGGELVQAEKLGGTLRAVSGIYAGARCVRCHERPGEMLGAFSYRLALENAPPSGPVLLIEP